MSRSRKDDMRSSCSHLMKGGPADGAPSVPSGTAPSLPSFAIPSSASGERGRLPAFLSSQEGSGAGASSSSAMGGAGNVAHQVQRAIHSSAGPYPWPVPIPASALGYKRARPAEHVTTSPMPRGISPIRTSSSERSSSPESTGYVSEEVAPKPSRKKPGVFGYLDQEFAGKHLRHVNPKKEKSAESFARDTQEMARSRMRNTKPSYGDMESRDVPASTMVGMNRRNLKEMKEFIKEKKTQKNLAAGSPVTFPIITKDAPKRRTASAVTVQPTGNQKYGNYIHI